MQDYIDEADKKIIGCLKENARYTFREISQKTGINEGTVRLRFNNMQKRGVFLGFSPTLDESKLGLGIHCLILVKTKLGESEKIAEKLRNFEEVRFCAVTTGTCDIIIEIFTRDPKTLSDFLNKRIASIEGVLETQTGLVLKTLKVNYIKINPTE